MRVYYRNLPHWRQPGATYFVAFRRADSTPRAVIAEWQDTRDRWFRAHRIDPNWLVSNLDRTAAEFEKIDHGVRMASEREQDRLLHDEIDRSHGSRVLRHCHPQTELAKSLFHFHDDRLAVGDWVIMPNNVHAIVQPFGDSELETIIGSIKQWTSRLIGEWLRTQPAGFQTQGPSYLRSRFWQQDSHDRIIRDAEELFRFRQYISENAMKANVPDGHFRYHATDWLDPFASRPVS